MAWLAVIRPGAILDFGDQCRLNSDGATQVQCNRLLSLQRADPDLHPKLVRLVAENPLMNWRYRHLRSVVMKCKDGRNLDANEPPDAAAKTIACCAYRHCDIMPIYSLKMKHAQDHSIRPSSSVMSQTGHQAQTTVSDICPNGVNSRERICKTTNFTGFFKSVFSGPCLAEAL